MWDSPVEQGCILQGEEEGLQLLFISLAGLVSVRSGSGPLMPEVGRTTWTRLLLDTQRHQMPSAAPFSLVPGAQRLCLECPRGVCVLSYLPILLGNEDFQSLFPSTE